MVCPGGDSEGEVGTEMGAARAVGEERSFKVPLHNFNLPSFLKWGHQRQLRCMKLPDSECSKKVSDGSKGNGSPPPARAKRSSEVMIREEGIEAVREKIMLDLKTAAERMRVAIFKDDVTAMAPSGSDDCENDEEEGNQQHPAGLTQTKADETVKRWNLRTRREPITAAARKSSFYASGTPGDVLAGGSKIAGDCGLVPPSPVNDDCGGRGEERKREKFSVTLTKKEIEEDYIKVFGHRPPRRPKKRPRTLQRQMDALFPGLWLTEVTMDIYKVPERLPDCGKR